MNTAQPIRNAEDLLHFKEYYKTTRPDKRNYLLMVIGLNTALRISDILKLCWGDVYDFELQKYREHLSITEQKTGKRSQILMNRNVQAALSEYNASLDASSDSVTADKFLFRSHTDQNRPISRIQAFRIVKKAAKACHLEGVISCHSLRKTFGYYAWQQGIEPALLMSIYNHSSFQVTVRYLGIEQDDRDRIFRDINL